MQVLLNSASITMYIAPNHENDRQCSVALFSMLCRYEHLKVGYKAEILFVYSLSSRIKALFIYSFCYILFKTVAFRYLPRGENGARWGKLTFTPLTGMVQHSISSLVLFLPDHVSKSV